MTDQPPDETPPLFEEALFELQKIVGQLEGGSLGLEDSMQQFERGTQLLRRCYQVLEAAERRIEIMTGLDSEGRPVTEPFDASATSEAPAATKPEAGKVPVARKASRSPRPDVDTLF